MEVQRMENERRRVLIVDDEPDMLSMLKLVLEKNCSCEVITAASGISALEQLEKHRPDAIITDIKMPDLDGLELLKRIVQLDPTVTVVIMTGYGTIDMAVQALKDGAYDFLQKPFEKNHIVRIVLKCLERTSLLRTNRQLQKKLSDLGQDGGFVGQSQALKRVKELLARVADTDATLLIRGESGTGKEVAARTLHRLSNRKDRPMITVNCPALPENVLESELFGYTKGAFTGAMHNKKGLFLEADGSTILLDEIADIPISVQTKLLRVLQEKEIQPLGQNKTIKIDVRVVASTNQDLEAKIIAGEFREDLFYRLNVVTVVMPNLNEMHEDVPLLIHHFLLKYKTQYNRETVTFPPAVLQCLYERKWQGNIRELQNSIKRLVLLSKENGPTLQDLPLLLEGSGEPCMDSTSKPMPNTRYDIPYNEAKAQVINDFSTDYLTLMLKNNDGNVTQAATACGLERQGFQRLMRRYGIKSADFKA